MYHKEEANWRLNERISYDKAHYLRGRKVLSLTRFVYCISYASVLLLCKIPLKYNVQVAKNNGDIFMAKLHSTSEL